MGSTRGSGVILFNISERADDKLAENGLGRHYQTISSSFVKNSTNNQLITLFP